MGQFLHTPCLKLGIAPKIPHLPALELELQGPKLRHPENFGHICWGKFEFYSQIFTQPHWDKMSYGPYVALKDPK